MQIENVIKQFKEELKALYDESELKALVKNALMYSLNISATDLLLKKKEQLSEKRVLKAENILKRLKMYEPLQYITGETEFMELKFNVNKNVLIPRPETEELVEWILEETKNEKLKTKNDFRILDIGTGSGCIAISLKKKLSGFEVTAIDISKEALLVARKNAVMNEVKINFKQADILTKSFSETQLPFDLIVSNPPYISNHEKAQMHRNVTDHEPHIALFVEGKNPLLFYDCITELASGNLLKPDGRLYFEMNEMYHQEIFEMMNVKGFIDIVVKQDLSGKNRMIHAVKK